MIGQQSKAKQVAITAMVAAIYAILFFGSAPGMLPGFTLLYLPVILLGVFPIWFGWSGLAGCMIGAFIGGVYVEQVAPYAAWVESVTALIIFGLNWILMPRNAAENKTKRNLILLLFAYAISLFHWNRLHSMAIYLSLQHRNYGVQYSGRFFICRRFASNVWTQLSHPIRGMPCFAKSGYAEVEKLGRLLWQLY